jgi:hypothetical protein
MIRVRSRVILPASSMSNCRPSQLITMVLRNIFSSVWCAPQTPITYQSQGSVRQGLFNNTNIVGATKWCIFKQGTIPTRDMVEKAVRTRNARMSTVSIDLLQVRLSFHIFPLLRDARVSLPFKVHRTSHHIALFRHTEKAIYASRSGVLPPASARVAPFNVVRPHFKSSSRPIPLRLGSGLCNLSLFEPIVSFFSLFTCPQVSDGSLGCAHYDASAEL